MPKNQHTQRKLFQNNPAMDYGLSKSAEIVLLKSIFYVKNHPNLSQLFFIEEYHQFRSTFFFLLTFLDKIIFLVFYIKMMPYF